MTTYSKAKAEKPRAVPCDHIRQYFSAGRSMPCANPYCTEGIGGEKMAALETVAVNRLRGRVEFRSLTWRREREGVNWWWEQE